MLESPLVNVLDYHYPPELPVSGHQDEILAALRAHPVVIVCGDTGSGKTTQLPKMALEAGCTRIACTQPRRLAAVTMAERVAAELQVNVGDLVGYQHRFGRKVSPATQVKFMTDGVLLAETRTDPLLRRYDAIIVDEAHERSLNVDFLLGILTRILARRRDLTVIVSSATLDVQRFSDFFGGAPVISVPGRLYPVTVAYRPPPPDEELDLPAAVADAVAEFPPRDDLLVFLPGERDIRETADVLADRRPDDDIIPLLASLPAAEQQRAFRLSARRRIILATNVAETSVTIPGIRGVIDSGLARISRYIHRTQVQRLQIEPISQASARQRQGRCGRLGPGTCLRLYSEEDFNARDPFTPPEVLRSSLAGVILTMLDLRLGDVERFPFLDPPKPTMVREGLRELLELGAIGHDEHGEVALTPTGRILAKIPVEPRLARMLVAAAERGVLAETLPLVAALACDDPRRRPVDEREKATQAHAPFRVPGSDFRGTLKLWTWWQEQSAALSQGKLRTLCKKTYLSYPKMREWRDLTRQLTDLAKRFDLSFAPAPEKERDALVHQALLAGLLGRIGRYDPEARDYRGTHGLRFALHPGSVLTKRAKAAETPPPNVVNAHRKPPQAAKPAAPAWIMAGELVDTARLFARNAAELDPRWIEPVAGPLCRHTYHSPEWDPESGYVRATEQVLLYGLVIVPARRCDFSRVNISLAREIFIRHALVEGAFPHPPPPVRQNREFLDALRRRAEKARRPEIFDAERLVAHFASVIPPDVASAPALCKWLRASSKNAPSFLLKKADWWPSENLDAADFPDTIRLGTVKMALTYRNTPDDPEEDGITCTVRRRDAAALRLWRADWLVPGMLPEKLMFLLSSLPSAPRRVLSPLADTVSGLLAHLKPGTEPLPDAMRRTIFEQWAVRLAPDVWANTRLPNHLRVRFRIRDDETGRVLAAGRDLEEVLAAAGIADSTARSSVACHPDGTVYTTWSFGTLRETETDSRAGWKLEHYPALHDEGNGVTLRLYADAPSAEAAHAAGVTRLFLLALDKHVRVPFRRKTLPLDAQLYLRDQDYPDDLIAADILAGAVRETHVRHQPPVRDEATFTRRLAACRNALVETECEMARLLGDVFGTAGTLSGDLATASVPAETVASLNTQLAWLLYRGFPRLVPYARLQHFPRYLKGAAMRLARARTNPGGDLSKEARFAPHWQRYLAAVTDKTAQRTAAQSAALTVYRWMLEEFRVSLFAQELHTPEPISEKRLDAQWQCVDAP